MCVEEWTYNLSDPAQINLLFMFIYFPLVHANLIFLLFLIIFHSNYVYFFLF